MQRWALQEPQRSGRRCFANLHMPKNTPRSLGLFAQVLEPIQELLGVRAASGAALIASAIAALCWANLHEASYRSVFELQLTLGAGTFGAHLSLRSLINEVLMAIFFFVVGMDLKHERVSGALKTLSQAALPAVAAAGGMVVPAAIYLAINRGGPDAAGWGIPMATDIAFCVGVLTLLDARVPRELVVFVTALAVFDDIGGILVIALFYGQGVDLAWLAAAVAVTLLLVVANRARVTNGFVYGGLMGALWYALHHSGVHATLSGVVVGLCIPARPFRPAQEVLADLSRHLSTLDAGPRTEELDADEVLRIEERLEELEAPLRRFTHLWHPLVAWVVMPLFAMANMGINLGRFGLEGLTSPVALGVGLGLAVGKPVGIFSFTLAAVKLKWGKIPGGASALELLGVSVVAGIGFTVALFIAMLALPGAMQLEQAKAGVLVGSVVAGLCGAALLHFRAGGRRAIPAAPGG